MALPVDHKAHVIDGKAIAQTIRSEIASEVTILVEKYGKVGLPNIGKSTLFNTLTKLLIPAENFPFCTIEPNEARINIPDERFEWLCQLFKPKMALPKMWKLQMQFDARVQCFGPHNISENLSKAVVGWLPLASLVNLYNFDRRQKGSITGHRKMGSRMVKQTEELKEQIPSLKYIKIVQM